MLMKQSYFKSLTFLKEVTDFICELENISQFQSFSTILVIFNRKVTREK